MKKSSIFLTLSLLLGLVLLSLASPAQADVRLSGPGRIKQGTTIQLEVFGFGVDLADDFNSGSTVSGTGVTGRITRRHSGPENFLRAGVRRNEGSAEIDFTAGGNAAAGLRTVTLRAITGNQTFQILVLRAGVVTNLNPRQATAATTVEFTFTGTRIGNARLVIAPLISGTTRLANSETEARFRVTFPDLTATRTYAFRLAEEGGAASDFNYEGSFNVEVTPNLSVPDCVSNPNLREVQLVAPASGTVLNFNPNDTSSQTDVTFRWRDDQAPSGKPNSRRYFFELSENQFFGFDDRNRNAIRRTTNAGILSTQVRLQRQRTYFWRVRVFNCDQPSPQGQTARLEIR